MAPLWLKVVPFVVSQLVITWDVGSPMALFFFEKIENESDDDYVSDQGYVSGYA